MGGRKGFGAGVEEIEGGEDEECEGHARGVGCGVLGREEGEETALPVFDVLGDVKMRFFFGVGHRGMLRRLGSGRKENAELQ